MNTPNDSSTSPKESPSLASLGARLKGEGEAPSGNLFRKKPVVIEAVQWNGNDDDMESFIGNSVPWQTVKDDTELAIRTLEGVMIASPGDWIIKGVKGEFYPCKPDIFEATYERVSSSVSPNVAGASEEEKEPNGGSPSHAHSRQHQETGELLTSRFTKEEAEWAAKIANDIAEDIDCGESTKVLRMAVQYWALQCSDEINKRLVIESGRDATALEKIGQQLDALSTINNSTAEDRIISEIIARRAKGLAKYGVGVERTDLTRAQWLQHAKEEALDLAIYLERCLSYERELQASASELPAKADGPSGPTDNDSKEEEWVVVVVRNEGQFAYYNLNGCHFYDSDISEKLKIVANAHNADLSALRARLQKQEEALRGLIDDLDTVCWMPPLMRGRVIAAKNLLSASAQSTALVHNQQISPTNPKHNK